MVRGFLSGSVLGLVVSGLTLGTASLVGEQPAGGRPPLAPVSEAPVRPEGSGTLGGAGADAVPGGAADPGGAPAPSETPGVALPGEGSPLPQADTAAPVAPDAGAMGQGLTAPTPTAPAPELSAAGEAQVFPSPLARAPEPPAADALAEVPADPVPAGPVAALVEDAPPAQPDAGAQPAAVSQPAAVADGTLLVEPQAPGAAATSGTVIVEIAPDPVPAPVPAPFTDADPEAAAEVDPSADPDAVTEPQADEQSVSDQPPAAEPAPAGLTAPEAAAPEVAEQSAQADPAPESLAPAPESRAADPLSDTSTEPAAPRIALQGEVSSLPGGTEAVRVIRPGSDTEAPAAEVPLDPAEAAVAEAAVDEAEPALRRYAVSFDNPEAKPLMSVILIDDGGLGGGAVAAVGTVPFPVTVAIDALAADAAAKMAAYRAAGIEVMALAALPEGALPMDVEVTLEAAFAALPDSVALLDAGAGGLQSDRAVTEQAMIRLALDGRGFVTASQGLNMALRSAEAVDVPAAVIYRDLDAEGQDARVIRRFLDQAAFRARQQAGVVLVGRVRGDTISALSLWGTANRAGPVTLAPVSATLLGPQGAE